MSWSIYLLSITDNICLIGWGALLFGPVSFIVGMTEGGEKNIRICNRITVLCLAVVFAAVLTPSRRGILEAYFMVEGVKVVNAQNAEKAIDEFTKRVDRIIDVLEKSDR